MGGEAETLREPAPIIDREARMMVVIQYEGHQEGEGSIKRHRLYITGSHDQNNYFRMYVYRKYNELFRQ